MIFTCSPVCVRKCRVKLAERGKTFPQYEHVYLSLLVERVLKYCNLFAVWWCCQLLNEFVGVELMLFALVDDVGWG